MEILENHKQHDAIIIGNMSPHSKMRKHAKLE